MISGLTKALAITVTVGVISVPTLAADPLLQRAVRSMDRETASAPKAGAKSPSNKDQDDRDYQGVALYHVNPRLDKAVVHAEQLIRKHPSDLDKLREAYSTLIEARRRAGKVPDPRVEALLGELALLQGQPARASRYVGPFIPEDVSSLRGDDLEALHNAVYIHGRAVLAEAVRTARDEARTLQRKPRTTINDFFGVPVGKGNRDIVKSCG